MSLYERIAARLIGTPLQKPAERLRAWKGARFRRQHPELTEWFNEGGRVDQAMARVVGRDTNCIDVGCHIGSFLQKIVELAPQGRHYAIEPVPEKASLLRKKFPGVTVIEGAVGDRTATVDYFVNVSQTSYSGLKARSVTGRIDSLKVRCATLDDVIPGDAKIGFVKIDVNGAELMVLRGGIALLKRDRPFVLLECTQGGLNDYGIDSDEVHDVVVREAGFEIRLLKDYLSGGAPLSTAEFRAAMQYPFKAFNFAVTPAGAAQ
jgi:FkbM family methyltransferase